MTKILLVEDDADILKTVVTFLKFEQFAVETTSDGLEAQALLKSFAYDLIILDWQLPGMSGVEICKDFRGRRGMTPVLMLTGLSSVKSKLEGLDSGADDYLTKPFDMRELGSRVRALLRRPASVIANNNLIAGHLCLDEAQRIVTAKGSPIALTPREYELFQFLMRHPNQALSGEALLNRVWPSDSTVTAEALRTAMKRLRSKIDPEAKVLKTIHGVGYILESSQ